MMTITYEYVDQLSSALLYLKRRGCGTPVGLSQGLILKAMKMKGNSFLYIIALLKTQQVLAVQLILEVL